MKASSSKKLDSIQLFLSVASFFCNCLQTIYVPFLSIFNQIYHIKSYLKNPGTHSLVLKNKWDDYKSLKWFSKKTTETIKYFFWWGKVTRECLKGEAVVEIQMLKVND